MKNKFCRGFLLGVSVLLVSFTACRWKKTDMVPIKEPETEITQTDAPTITEATEPTVTPTPDEAEVPTVEDTYMESIVTDEFFSNEWMNLRFTSQPGFEFGTRDGVEMYARYGNEAMVEVYTEVLTEEEQKLTEEEYVQLLIGKLLNDFENAKLLQQSETGSLSVNGDGFTWIWSMIDDGNGRIFYRDYIVRKKEVRMIVITMERAYSGASLQATTNLISCFGAYDNPPVYLPEEWLEPNPFERGSFTGNGYENKWLNLRISLPENVILTDLGSDMADSVYAEMEWETSLPYVQFMVTYAYNKTAEQLLNERMEQLQAEALAFQEEGMVFTVNEENKTDLFAGEEYVVRTSSLTRPENEERYQEYYCRVQDNYIVYFHFFYKKDCEEQINEFKKLITTY